MDVLRNLAFPPGNTKISHKELPHRRYNTYFAHADIGYDRYLCPKYTADPHRCIRSCINMMHMATLHVLCVLMM